MINIALCLLGYIPGLIHAWVSNPLSVIAQLVANITLQYIICTYPDPGYEPIDGSESQVHVYYIRGGPPPPSAGPGPGAHSTPQGGYGTIAPKPIYAPQQPPNAKQLKDQPTNSGSANPPSSSSAAASSSTPREASATAPAAGPAKGAHEADAGPSEGPPPSYAEVVQGDHKIQSHE